MSSEAVTGTVVKATRVNGGIVENVLALTEPKPLHPSVPGLYFLGQRVYSNGRKPATRKQYRLVEEN